MKRTLLLLFFCLFFTVSFKAQNNLLRELLDLPAPPPTSTSGDIDGERPKHPPEFYDSENVPADDAPIEDLIDFWSRQNNIPYQIYPKEKTLKRLIESLNQAPENLPNFLSMIPANQENAALIKDIYDQQSSLFDEDEHKDIGKWLKYSSSYFSDELLAEARNARDHKSYETVIKRAELEALAKVDWEKAAPLLEKLKDDSSNPRTAFLAKRLLYEHAIEKEDSARIENFRDAFQKIVQNKSASGKARDEALEALIENKEWPGQDDWYISLFEDGTLLTLKLSGNSQTLPLNEIVSKNPDKWIPIAAKLVSSQNSDVHNAAVQALAQFQNSEARKDALEPLIPWISNPDWAKTGSDERFRLIQSIENVDLPAAVPGLIWALQNDPESYTRSYAAESLAKYQDPQIAPAMIAALQIEPQETHRKRIIEALIKSNNLTAAEQLAYLERYAAAISTPEGYKDVAERDEYEEEAPLPVAVSIGRYLALQVEPSNEDLIRMALMRLEILKTKNPAIAKILSGIMSKWRARLVGLELLGRVEKGSADTATIITLLVRREDIKKRFSNELSAMIGKNRLSGAISACLMEDKTQILSAFHSENIEKQVGTLACTRLLRRPLPVYEVGALLNSSDKLLALAAEKYLESEDSIEARQLVLAKHPDEALILGARASYDGSKSEILKALDQLYASVDRSFGNHLLPNSSSLTELDDFENKLRKEIIANHDLLEIYTLVPNYVIRIYKNRVVLNYFEDKSRFREGELKKEEFDELKRYFEESKFEEMPPYFDNCHYDCGMFEYAHFNRNGGRRFFAYSGFTRFLGIWAKFQDLSEAPSMKRHYYLETKIKGLEVLLTDKTSQPKTVWKNGEDFRLLISDEKKEEQIEEEIRKLDKIDDDTEDLDDKIRQRNAFKRRAERAVEHLEWREFKNGKLGAKTEEPAEVPFLRDKLSFPDVGDLDSNDNTGQSKYGTYEIRRGSNGDQNGLWKVNRSEKIKIADGWFGGSPIVSGDWVVAAKTDSNWSAPNDVVRVNLLTGKEFKIKLPPADDFEPVAFIAVHHKILLRRAADSNTKLKNNPSPATPEYYLLDAATGKTEMVKGEFQPLRQQTYRTLQRTGKPDEFWAAVHNRDKNETDIGIYDERNFTFKSILKLPDILVDSMNIWVDEKEAKVYFVYAGDYSQKAQLLSVPLPVRETIKLGK